jgi:hypothetical protein
VTFAATVPASMRIPSPSRSAARPHSRAVGVSAGPWITGRTASRATVGVGLDESMRAGSRCGTPSTFLATGFATGGRGLRSSGTRVAGAAVAARARTVRSSARAAGFGGLDVTRVTLAMWFGLAARVSATAATTTGFDSAAPAVIGSAEAVTVGVGAWTSVAGSLATDGAEAATTAGSAAGAGSAATGGAGVGGSAGAGAAPAGRGGSRPSGST